MVSVCLAILSCEIAAVVFFKGVLDGYFKAGFGFYGIASDLNGNIFLSQNNFTSSRSSSVVKISKGWNGDHSTFAGGIVNGRVDGQGTDASFDRPEGLAVDSSGNVYVADKGNNAIRKITPTGLVSTLAGTGVLGSTNGPKSLASFSYPSNVAVDFSGNVFVTEANHTVRKITPSGDVSILAGSSSPGYVDGANVSARFNTPTGIAVDKSGNVYVADKLNQKIRKISVDGVVSTMATFSTKYPRYLFMHPSGNLLVLAQSSDSPLTSYKLFLVDLKGNVSEIIIDSLPTFVQGLLLDSSGTFIVPSSGLTIYDAACAKGYIYSNAIFDCVPCPAGKTSDIGSRICNDIAACAKGYIYSNTTFDCVPCPAGKTSKPGDRVCYDIPSKSLNVVPSVFVLFFSILLL